MKYTIALLTLAAGVLALPQESASITSAPVASASLTPQVSCALDCDPADVTCQAACMGIARPNSSQAVASNECAAKCDQGSGSPEDTVAYAKCQQDCFASLFPSTQTDFPGAGGAASVSSAASSAASAAGSAASSGASAVETGATAATSSGPSDSASGSPTGTAAEASETPGSANANNVKIVGAGLAGLMAVFAL